MGKYPDSYAFLFANGYQNIIGMNAPVYAMAGRSTDVVFASVPVPATILLLGWASWIGWLEAVQEKLTTVNSENKLRQGSIMALPFVAELRGLIACQNRSFPKLQEIRDMFWIAKVTFCGGGLQNPFLSDDTMF